MTSPRVVMLWHRLVLRERQHRLDMDSVGIAIGFAHCKAERLFEVEEHSLGQAVRFGGDPMSKRISTDRELPKNAFARRRIKVAHCPDFPPDMVHNGYLSSIEPCRSSALWYDADRAHKRR